MTRFEDGPAAGITLPLRRAPLYLRVVRDPDGKWDALDQPDDRPAVDEEVTAYRKVRDDGAVHLCVRGKNRAAGGWYAGGTYAVCDPQPDRLTLRTQALWQAWALAQAGGTKP